MAQFDYKGIGISHLFGCVPKNTVVNRSYTDYFSSEIAKAIVNKTGIEERRFADSDTCASDLCFEAANQLFRETDLSKDDIKILVFVTQTADYRMPGNAILLQDRLGLGKDVMAFDINIGCSGFIYGLNTVYSLIQNISSGKALLLVGETRSKVYSPKDRKTAFLFGDAGIACVVEKNEVFGSSYFDLYSDGSHASLINMPGGGYRNPSSSETIKMKVIDDEGNQRSDEHGQMDGAEVFNFVLQHVPRSIKALLFRTHISMDEVGAVVLHQANRFMNEHLVKKLKINQEKVITNVTNFGNTSSVSIPLAIITESLHHDFTDSSVSLLSGFGVGMSWANALINLERTHIGTLTEC